MGSFRGDIPWGLLVGADLYVKIIKGRIFLLSFPASFCKIFLHTILLKGGYMYNITDLLNLEDTNLNVTSIISEGTVKTITIETDVTSHYCPCCGFRMHSRGIRQRKISHPILQDGCSLFLLLKQRRWRCTNNDCRYEINDSFRFVDKRRRSTNATDMLIISSFIRACICLR